MTHWLFLTAWALLIGSGCGNGTDGPAAGAADQGATDTLVGAFDSIPPQDGGFAQDGDPAQDTNSPVQDAAPPCPPQLAWCQGACIDLQTRPEHCGACDTACPASHVCTDGSCTPMPTDCRTGEGCPTAYYCDLNDGKCKPGCASDTQCPQPGYCELQSHSCRCDAGYHACGDSCLSNSSIDHCGSSCVPCPTVKNASPTCNGQSCGFSCHTGFHACSDQCVTNNSVATCGSRCTPCPTDPNGQATCDGQSCGLDCDEGYHLCGGSCVDSSAVSHCGTSCSPCPTPPNANATCDGQSCGISCLGGYYDCNEDPADGCEETFARTCYQDNDEDGYGVPGVTQQFFCACPAGWTNSASPADCLDSNPDVHPEQSYYFTEPHDGTFDFDCDGEVTKQYYTVVYGGCHTYTSTYCPKGFYDAVPECGETGSYVTCAKALNSYDPCWTYTSTSVTVGCR